MSDKELIKAEIERRINDLKGYVLQKGSDQRWVTAIDQLTCVKAFIDSLPEESGCEINFTTKSEDLVEELDNFLKDPVFGKLINRNAGIALARHFAEWQKQQMMKDAIECVVEDWCGDSPEITIPLNPQDFKNGDKVKIIIVKEECYGR